jgi:hypothetical protein
MKNRLRATRLTNETSFLSTIEEKENYAGAIYQALLWGDKIDMRNKRIKDSDKSIHS